MGKKKQSVEAAAATASRPSVRGPGAKLKRGEMPVGEQARQGSQMERGATNAKAEASFGGQGSIKDRPYRSAQQLPTGVMRELPTGEGSDLWMGSCTERVSSEV